MIPKLMPWPVNQTCRVKKLKSVVYQWKEGEATVRLLKFCLRSKSLAVGKHGSTTPDLPNVIQFAFKHYKIPKLASNPSTEIMNVITNEIFLSCEGPQSLTSFHSSLSACFRVMIPFTCYDKMILSVYIAGHHNLLACPTPSSLGLFVSASSLIFYQSITEHKI